MKTFDNVAKLKLATLTTGQFVETGGYYTKGDDGAAKYLIVAPQAADETDDHTIANGNVAEKTKVGTYSAGRIRGTAEDDQGSPDAIIAVERNQGGENSPHSFRDNSNWTPAGASEPAFASYDADVDIYDEVITDHFIDYQARGRKFGSAIMKTMWGFASANRVDDGHVNKATAFENKFRISPEATCTTYTSFQSEPAVYGDTGTITHFQVRQGFTLPETNVGSETGLYIKAMQFASTSTTRPILIEPQREGVKNLISCETEFTRDQEVTDKDYGFVIRSPDNSRWRITVDNSGALSATAI